MTDVVRDPSTLSARTAEIRAAGGRVGFVPTMGALHEGHLALVRDAVMRTDETIVSIFVNPLQFGPLEDLERYPRDLDRDASLLAPLGVNSVFAPSVEAMYPPGAATRVRVEGLTSGLCGPHRPGHFEGVTTVCARLFGIVGPCVAVFGRKDYQQLQVVARMVRDLSIPVEIVGHPTVREADGLAMSSRNAYLSVADRARARALPAGLCAAWDAFGRGERSAGALRTLVRGRVEASADGIDYVAVADPDDLSVVTDGEPVGERALVAVAARVGSTRLIDNVVLGEDDRPVPATGRGNSC